MRYSVWNQSKGSYNIYESPSLPVPSFKKGTNLGSIPRETMEALPPGSKYLGESEFPEGKIVTVSFSFGQLVFIVFATVAARWIYEHILDLD